MPKKPTSSGTGRKRRTAAKASASAAKAKSTDDDAKTGKTKSPKRSDAKAKAAAKPAAKKAPAGKDGRATAKGKTAALKVDKPAKARGRVGRTRAAARPRNGDGDGLLPKVPAAPPKAPKRRKTKLTPEDLEEFRRLLIEKRRELVGDVTHLESEAMRQGSTGGGSASSSMPIHMADLGSDTWEQELTMGLIENERGLLREIDEALDRIENKTYGICLATNKTITKSRLRAKPWAKYCIEYARKRELGLV